MKMVDVAAIVDLLKTKFSFDWVYRYLKLALKTRINFAKLNIEDIKQCWKVRVWKQNSSIVSKKG